jgi:lysyl-tRNA synthetase class 2
MKSIIKKRSRYIEQIRNFFKSQNFLEVETPIMTPIPGMEPHLNPFKTTLEIHNHSSINLFLNTSPELQMKKLLGQGLKKIFQITKVFRNGEINGPLHNPEFTMLEWYRQNNTYEKLMEDCENLIKSLTKKNSITFQNKKINLSTPWSRISTRELFIKYCKIDLLKNKTFRDFKKTAKEKTYDTNGCKNWDDIYFKIFLNHIEPFLPNDPIFIFDYPMSQAALAKKKDSNSFFAERFELYIGKMELANAFTELTDSKEQRLRLKEEQKLRKKMKKPIFDIDEEFLRSLESISNPAAGIALGIDRLLMLLMNKKNIEEVILFPLNNMLWHQQQVYRKDSQ